MTFDTGTSIPSWRKGLLSVLLHFLKQQEKAHGHSARQVIFQVPFNGRYITFSEAYGNFALQVTSKVSIIETLPVHNTTQNEQFSKVVPGFSPRQTTKEQGQVGTEPLVSPLTCRFPYPLPDVFSC